MFTDQVRRQIDIAHTGVVGLHLMLKFAAGRETTMKDFQGLLLLAGMNRMITGGYLTTRGRSIAEDRAFLASLNCFISAGSGGQMQ